jgi:Fe-S-cluster-containing hydrogenase component 2
VKGNAPLCAAAYMAMSLLVTPKLCKDCGTCESVCDKFAIDVFSFEEGLAEISVPVTCMHCEKAACIDVCPTKALYRDANSTVLVNADKCMGCKMCVNACPFGNIEYNYNKKRIEKCDLCGGSPLCAKYCPTRAIEYVSATESNLSLKRALAEKYKGLLELN